MLGVLKIFFRAPGTHPWAVLLCLLLAGLAEGIGIASLLPLVSVATQGAGGADSSEIGRIVAAGLRRIGLAPEIEVLIAVVIGSIVAKALITMLAMRYVGYAVAEVSTGLRRQLIQGLLDVRWDYFVRLPGGRVANAVSDEATRAGRGYMMAAQFLALGLRTAIYAGVALLVSWRLALAAFAVGAVMWVSLHFLVRIARKAGRRQTQRTAELVTEFSDALGNIKPLKAMAKQDAFAALLGRKVEGLKKALRRHVTSTELLKGMQDVMTALALGAGFLLAIVLWRYVVAEILVVSIVLLQMVNNLGKMQREYQRAVQLESPYLALRGLIAEVQAARERPHGGRAPSLERELAFADVSFSFGRRPVLDRVSFDVPAGTLAVITGPSGAGKTTLTDLLLGLREPTDGRILLDGVPLAELDLAAWRGMIGYVPQELVLFHDTVLANVAVGDPRIGEGEARAALEQAGAWDFVAAMPGGLHSVVGERGAALSGGQRQRIALARALAARPKLLILDEVTSALDPDTERDICRHLAGLAGRVTIVAITHRAAFREIADAVHRLEDGRLRLDTAPLARAAGD